MPQINPIPNSNQSNKKSEEKIEILKPPPNTNPNLSLMKEQILKDIRHSSTTTSVTCSSTSVPPLTAPLTQNKNTNSKVSQTPVQPSENKHSNPHTSENLSSSSLIAPPEQKQTIATGPTRSQDAMTRFVVKTAIPEEIRILLKDVLPTIPAVITGTTATDYYLNCFTNLRTYELSLIFDVLDIQGFITTLDRFKPYVQNVNLFKNDSIPEIYFDWVVRDKVYGITLKLYTRAANEQIIDTIKRMREMAVFTYTNLSIYINSLEAKGYPVLGDTSYIDLEILGLIREDAFDKDPSQLFELVIIKYIYHKSKNSNTLTLFLEDPRNIWDILQEKLPIESHAIKISHTLWKSVRSLGIESLMTGLTKLHITYGMTNIIPEYSGPTSQFFLPYLETDNATDSLIRAKRQMIIIAYNYALECCHNSVNIMSLPSPKEQKKHIAALKLTKLTEVCHYNKDYFTYVRATIFGLEEAPHLVDPNFTNLIQFLKNYFAGLNANHRRNKRMESMHQESVPQMPQMPQMPIMPPPQMPQSTGVPSYYTWNPNPYVFYGPPSGYQQSPNPHYSLPGMSYYQEE